MDEQQVVEIWDKISGTVATYGMSVVGAIIILIAGLWLSGVAGKGMRRLLGRSGKIDPTVIGFFASMVRYAVIIVTILAVLDRFGVETTSLIALLGAAGLAVGLALQGTLANFAAGIMLLIFRPFKVGHYVDAGGIAGTVKEISLFFTDMDTPDNVRITVPNSQIWGQSIRNFSFNATRRIDIPCGIAYEGDIDKALGVMRQIADAESRVLADPAATVFVDALADSSVNLVLRIWCAAADYWQLKWDLTKAVKQGFDGAGIDIPFPQRTLHIRGDLGGVAKS